MKNIGLLFVFSILGFNLFSQSNHNRCGADHHHELQMEDPDFAQSFNKFQKEIYDAVDHEQRIPCGAPLLIPVAVHFNGNIDASNPQCLIDKCLEQIAVLNEDFGGYNADITNYCDLSDACPTDYPADVVTGGACMQFCLGSTNHPACEPAANLIGGFAITVGQYSWTGGEDAPCWSGYMNIFVEDNTGFLGIAPLFGGADPDGNGFQVDAGAFGGNLAAPCTSGTSLDNFGSYNLGRTATHEAGHYFGLQHTFAGCGGGDGISDTPPQNSSNFGCPSVNTNNCNSTANSCGTIDFWFNYMDYVNDACMWMFTEEQSQVMFNVANGASWNSGKCSSTQFYNPTFPNGCLSSTIPVDLNLISQADPLCAGESTGSIEVEAIGGTPPFTFLINGTSNGSNPVFNLLNGGFYTIEVQDAAGQSDILNVTLNEPDAFSAEAVNIEQVNCNGLSSGYFDVFITGGTSPYDVTINGNAFGDQTSFDNLPADTYDVTVEDNNNCLTQFQLEITEPNELNAEAFSITNVDCFGADNGTADISIVGGTGPYDLTMNGFFLGDQTSFINLGPDFYFVNIIDANNCAFDLEFEITEPPQMNEEVTVQDASCFNTQDGSFQLSIDGGEAPYNLNFDGQDYGSQLILNNLEAGTYPSVITDNNDCSINFSIEISAPPEIEISLDDSGPKTCYEDSDAFMNFTASGGSAGFTYTINNSTTNTTGLFENISGDSLFILVEDQNECLFLDTFLVPGPALLELNTSDLVNNSCFGESMGSLDLVALGGNGNNTFELEGYGINTTGRFENLPSDIPLYATVTDANNCIAYDTIELSQPEEIEVSLLNLNEVSCGGNNDGLIEVVAEGGSGTFMYSLDNGTPQTSGLFSDLSGGNYIINVQDNSGCSVDYPVELSEDSPLALSLNSVVDAQCEGDFSGSISVTASGGAGMIVYTLDAVTNDTGVFNGLTVGNYTVTATDEMDCTDFYNFEILATSTLALQTLMSNDPSCFGENDGQIEVVGNNGQGTNYMYSMDGVNFSADGIFSNLSIGNYTVWVQDDSGCTSMEMYTLSEPNELIQDDLNFTDLSCFDANDGNIQIDYSGGSGSLTYSIPELSLSNNTGLFENLPQGTFMVEIMDENACQKSVSVMISGPAEITYDILNTVDSNCDGDPIGSFQIEAAGGSGGFSYEIDGSNNSNGNFELLSAGIYNVSITDNNDCQIIVPVNVGSGSDILTDQVMFTPPSCANESDGSIVINASGGTGTLTYELDGETNTTGMFNNLPEGNYTVVISDEADCELFENFVLNDPEELMASVLNTTPSSCDGGGSGTVELNVIGGNGGYQFMVDGMSNTTGNFSGLSAGDYTATITDLENCMVSVNFSIDGPPAINGFITNQGNVSCFGGNDGFVLIGSDLDVDILVDGVVFDGAALSSLEAGTYSFVLVTADNCTETLTAEISQPEEITTDIVALTDNTCLGLNDGSVTINSNGGNGSFQYELNGATNTSGTFEDLASGNYNINILDALGCEAQQLININAGAQINASISSSGADTGDENGFIDIAVNGGTAPYNFELDGETFTTSNIQNLAAGSYSVIIIDQEGCQTTLNFEIELMARLDDKNILNVTCRPNPTKRDFLLGYESNGDQLVDFYIFDARGQFVKKESQNALSGVNQKEFVFEDLAHGVYLIQIQGEKLSITKKVIIID